MAQVGPEAFSCACCLRRLLPWGGGDCRGGGGFFFPTPTSLASTTAGRPAASGARSKLARASKERVCPK